MQRCSKKGLGKGFGCGATQSRRVAGHRRNLVPGEEGQVSTLFLAWGYRVQGSGRFRLRQGFKRPSSIVVSSLRFVLEFSRTTHAQR